MGVFRQRCMLEHAFIYWKRKQEKYFFNELKVQRNSNTKVKDRALTSHCGAHQSYLDDYVKNEFSNFCPVLYILTSASGLCVSEADNTHPVRKRLPEVFFMKNWGRSRNLKFTVMSVLTVLTVFVFHSWCWEPCSDLKGQRFQKLFLTDCIPFSGYLIIVLFKCSPNRPVFNFFYFHSLEKKKSSSFSSQG